MIVFDLLIWLSLVVRHRRMSETMDRVYLSDIHNLALKL